MTVVLIAAPVACFCAMVGIACCVAAGRADQNLEELRHDGGGNPQGAGAGRRDLMAPAPVLSLAEHRARRELLELIERRPIA